MTEKEKTLLAACLRGEKAAWDELVGQYSGLIYHTIKKSFVSFHIEPTSDRVDDIFQEVFLGLVKDDCSGLRRFRGDRGCTLASWLRMIAVRRTIDHLRQLKNPSRQIQELPEEADPYPPQDFLDSEQKTRLTAAIKILPPRDRIMIDLFFRRGLPADKVAAILGTSLAAVYTQKSRILSKLREILQKAGGHVRFSQTVRLFHRARHC